MTAYDEWRRLCAARPADAWRSYRGPFVSVHVSDPVIRWCRIADVPVQRRAGRSSGYVLLPKLAYDVALQVNEGLAMLAEVVVVIDVLRDGPERCKAHLALRALERA